MSQATALTRSLEFSGELRSGESRIGWVIGTGGHRIVTCWMQSSLSLVCWMCASMSVISAALTSLAAGAAAAAAAARDHCATVDMSRVHAVTWRHRRARAPYFRVTINKQRVMVRSQFTESLVVLPALYALHRHTHTQHTPSRSFILSHWYSRKTAATTRTHDGREYAKTEACQGRGNVMGRRGSCRTKCAIGRANYTFYPANIS